MDVYKSLDRHLTVGLFDLDAVWVHLGVCIKEQPPLIFYLLLLPSRTATRVVFDSQVKRRSRSLQSLAYGNAAS